MDEMQLFEVSNSKYFFLFFFLPPTRLVLFPSAEKFGLQEARTFIYYFHGDIFNVTNLPFFSPLHEKCAKKKRLV